VELTAPRSTFLWQIPAVCPKALQLPQARTGTCSLGPQTTHVCQEATAYSLSARPSSWSGSSCGTSWHFNRPSALAPHSLYQKPQNYGFLTSTEHLTHTDIRE